MNTAVPAAEAPRKRTGVRLTLTQRLLILALIALTPATLMLIYNEVDFRRAQLADLHDDAARNARLMASEVEQIFDGIRGVLTTVSAAPVLRSEDPAACHEFLASVVAKVPQIAAIVVTDTTGAARCRSADGPGSTNLAAIPVFKSVMDTGTYTVGRYALGQVSREPRLPVALPIIGSSGKTEGVVVSAVNLDWLGARIRARGIDFGGAVVIADSDGVVVAREPDSQRYIGVRIPDAFRHLVNAPAPGTLELVNPQGRRRVAGYIPATVSPTGLYIGASNDSDEAFETIERSTRRSLIFLGIGAVATLVLAWWFGRTYITHKVMRVVRTTETWRKGDLSARTHMDGREGEIEAVAQAFDLLADELALRQRERDKADQQRELLLRELTHRVRNVLATVQSVASLSFRQGQGPDAVRGFSMRLQALARSHELLTRKQWEAADIAEVVRDAISPLRGEDDRRFSVGGPSVLLSSAATVSVSMMLHELATNAVKYGALSTDAGRVSISWSADIRRNEVDLRLQWQEYGGPPVETPTRVGFGSRLLPALAQEMGGDVQISYLRDGVSCTMRLRLPRLPAEVASP